MIILKHKLDGVVGERVAQLHDAPQGLYYKGTDPEAVLVSAPSVAIVGSRKLSDYSRVVTEKLATVLARAGVTVISGLAFGVDVTAQQAVVLAGGRTMAVLAH